MKKSISILLLGCMLFVSNAPAIAQTADDPAGITPESSSNSALQNADNNDEENFSVPEVSSSEQSDSSSSSAEPASSSNSESISLPSNPSLLQSLPPIAEAKANAAEKPENSPANSPIIPYAGTNIETLPAFSGSIIHDGVISFVDGDNQPVDPNEVLQNTFVKFAFDFVIPEDLRVEMNPGDYYEFTLPPQVKVLAKQTYSLLGPGDVSYGTAHVNIDGTVRLVFNDNVSGNESYINGSVHFLTSLNTTEIGKPGPSEILPPDGEDFPSTPIIVKPSTNTSISKKGSLFPSPSAKNPTHVVWNVTINQAMDTIQNATVTETFPTGLTYKSLTVYTTNVDFNGNVTGDRTLVTTNSYSVDASGNVTFFDDINKTYILEYVTEIAPSAKPDPSESGTIKFTNKAELGGSNIDDSEASVTVSAAFSPAIEKKRTKYDLNTQEFTWTVTLNSRGQALGSGSTLMQDVMSSNMELVAGSVVVTTVTYNSDGTPVTPAPDLAAHTEDTADGFDLIADEATSAMLVVVYKTKITDTIVSEDEDVTNYVTDQDGNESGNTWTAPQQNLIKSHSTIDYANYTIPWTIQVNKNRQEMQNWTLTDTLGPGLLLLSQTLRIYDSTGSKALIPQIDYTLNYTPSNSTFKIVFHDPYTTTNHHFRITYDTLFDATRLEEGESFTNHVSAEWSDGINTHTPEAKPSTVKPLPASQDGGAKTGSYNAQTKEITWSVLVNYSRSNLINASVTDPILGNQAYVPNSMHIYEAVIATNGSWSKGTDVTDDTGVIQTLTPPASNNNQTLSVAFVNHSGSDNKAYVIEYKTTVDGFLVQSTYTNTADYTNNKKTYPLTASVSIYENKPYAQKSGEQNTQDGYVYWTLVINPSQSTLINVVVTDHPSSALVLEYESIQIFDAFISVDGESITAGNPVGEGVAAISTPQTDPTTGQDKLEIQFSGTINKPYVITYRTISIFPNGINAQTVSNSLQVTADNIEEEQPPEEGHVNVIITSGAGTAQGTAVGFSIKKIDAITGETLPGASFEVTRMLNNKMLRWGNSDSDGIFEVGRLPVGQYLVQEVKAPEGYAISQELADGVVVYADINTMDPSAAIVLENTRMTTGVRLTKTAEDTSIPVVGATFMLEQKIDDEWINLEELGKLITDSDGILSLPDPAVMYGETYRLTELSSPPPYLINTTPIEFTPLLEEGVLIQPELSMLNYPGVVTWQKIAADSGKSLAGATYKIVDIEELEVMSGITTDSDGRPPLIEIAPGEYRLIETAPPDGYELNETPVDFSVPFLAAGKPDIIDLGMLSNTLIPVSSSSSSSSSSISSIASTPKTGVVSASWAPLLSMLVSLSVLLPILLLKHRRKRQ